MFLSKIRIIIWFDDDTCITTKYFEELNRAKKYSDAEIFVPVIMGRDGTIHSMYEVGIISNRRLKITFEQIYYNKITAINSCMAVKLNVYKRYRYDVGLFFVQEVDHNFFDNQRDLKTKIERLPVVIYHDFSIKNKMNVNQMKIRYNIKKFGNYRIY